MGDMLVPMQNSDHLQCFDELDERICVFECFGAFKCAPKKSLIKWPNEPIRHLNLRRMVVERGYNCKILDVALSVDLICNINPLPFTHIAPSKASVYNRVEARDTNFYFIVPLHPVGHWELQRLPQHSLQPTVLTYIVIPEHGQGVRRAEIVQKVEKVSYGIKIPGGWRIHQIAGDERDNYPISKFAHQISNVLLRTR